MIACKHNQLCEHIFAYLEWTSIQVFSTCICTYVRMYISLVTSLIFNSVLRTYMQWESAGPIVYALLNFGIFCGSAAI